MHNFSEANSLTIKLSRFNVINMMREKANLALAIWDEFKNLDWDDIEEITEATRISYNEFVNLSGEPRSLRFGH